MWIVEMLQLLCPFKVFDSKGFIFLFQFIFWHVALICYVNFCITSYLRWNSILNEMQIPYAEVTDRLIHFFIFFWYPIKIFSSTFFCVAKYFMLNSNRDCCQVVSGKTKKIFTKKTSTNFV